MPYIFRNLYTRNNAKYEQQNEFLTKHCMFSLKFTQSLNILHGSMAVWQCGSIAREWGHPSCDVGARYDTAEVCTRVDCAVLN